MSAAPRPTPRAPPGSRGPPNVPTLPMETIIERTRQTYDGPLVASEDLMSFTISRGAVTQNPVPL